MRMAETTTSMPCDAEPWLDTAHAANDGEAVTSFTNVHGTRKRLHEECTSKRRGLHGLTIRWEHYFSRYDKLALQLAHRACATYGFAQATETALQHL